MRPILVEVGHILPEHASQVGLAQHHDVIRAFAPDAAEEPLARGVLARCAVGRPPLRDAARRRDARERRPILAVAITDEIARPLAEGRRLAQLLGDPGIRRVARDADVHHPARAERDHDESVEGPEEQVGDLQEVAGPGLGGVIAEERRPGLPGAARWTGAAHVPLDRGLGDADTQLQQLPADALGAPQPIRGGHLLNQRDRLGRHLRLRRRPGS